MNPDVTIDLRPLLISRRHETVDKAFVSLRPGGEILVVGNRDFRTLREALERDHPGEFTWTDLTRGVPRWRALITRSAAQRAKTDSTSITARL